MAAREGDSRAIFVADVTDPTFAEAPEDRTVTFKAVPGTHYRTVGNKPVTIRKEGDLVRVTYPAYGAFIVTAEKE